MGLGSKFTVLYKNVTGNDAQFFIRSVRDLNQVMRTWELESIDTEMQNRMSLLSNEEWSNLVKELTPLHF